MEHSVADRTRIAQEAGLSLGYVQKHMYVSQHRPVFRFHNAVAMDKASNGALPFRQHTETLHAFDHIDWAYVRRSLNRDYANGAR